MEDLRAIFGGAYANHIQDVTDPASFYWFNTPDGSSFGIRKSGITEKEFQLLKMHYKLIEQPTLLTPEQQAWAEILFEGKQPAIDLGSQLTQFIYISLKNDLADRSAFEEALLGYFSKPAIILWPESDLGILIAPLEPDELLDGDALLELLSTDFFVTARVGLGTPFKDIEQASQLFQYEKKAFLSIQTAYPHRAVFYHAEFLPMMLLVEHPTKEFTLSFGTLTEFLDGEPDMRTYLEVFFKCNLNLSTTAKTLFMHRNSLHYRFDKLKEKTGLDPREFRDAQLINLELLFHKKKS